jgi:KDO2-lipid IV(A) lauroyltransferase
MTTAVVASRDVRLGERWTTRQRLKNTAIYLAIRAALAIADRLPEAWLGRLGGWLGRLVCALLPALRQRAERALAHAFPDRKDTARLAALCFRCAGENLAECLVLRRPSVLALNRIDIEPGSLAVLDSALSEGRGAVFVSAHLGPFELIAASIAELGYRPVAVTRESYDPRLNPIVDRHRALRGIGVLHRGRTWAMARSVRALRSGRLLGLLPDLGGRVPSADVDWFGRPARLAIGVARLSLGCDAPIVVGVLLAGAARPLLRIRRLCSESGDAAVLTQRVALALEAAIRQNPEQWLGWFGPRSLQAH